MAHVIAKEGNFSIANFPEPKPEIRFSQKVNKLTLPIFLTASIAINFPTVKSVASGDFLNIQDIMYGIIREIFGYVSG